MHINYISLKRLKLPLKIILQFKDFNLVLKKDFILN